jgi:hypothetical protein
VWLIIHLVLGLSALAGPRIVAVGDLHADPSAAFQVLQMAGIVDGAGRWIAGDTVLIQTGDSTDKGPSSLQVAQLLMRLETEATAAGGRLITLLGNHEVMNLQNDLRYVHPLDTAEFGGPEARQAAFAPTGALGRWYRSRNAVAVVDGNLFVHGGVSARFAHHSASALSQMVRAGIDGSDPERVLGREGPLWYRGFFLADEAIACAEAESVLAQQGARRMIVGHTVQREGRIGVRCGGRLIGIDTGISAIYGNHLSALEITADDARAIYPSAPKDLPDPPPNASTHGTSVVPTR